VLIHKKIGKKTPPHPNQAKRVTGIRAVERTKANADGIVATAVNPAPGNKKPKAAALSDGFSNDRKM
jgi:hypothetical protein